MLAVPCNARSSGFRQGSVPLIIFSFPIFFFKRIYKAAITRRKKELKVKCLLPLYSYILTQCKSYAPEMNLKKTKQIQKTQPKPNCFQHLKAALVQTSFFMSN